MLSPRPLLIGILKAGLLAIVPGGLFAYAAWRLVRHLWPASRLGVSDARRAVALVGHHSQPSKTVA